MYQVNCNTAFLGKAILFITAILNEYCFRKLKKLL